MSLPLSIMTPSEAASYVYQVALLTGLRRTSWDNATPENQQAALDAGWQTIASTPGYALACATGSEAVRQAVVVEALVYLATQADPGAAQRALLQAQGVTEVYVGGVREVWGKKGSLHPASTTLLRRHRSTTRIR